MVIRIRWHNLFPQLPIAQAVTLWTPAKSIAAVEDQLLIAAIGRV
jgi:hypothetical protein